jgi:hypothetical protein
MENGVLPPLIIIYQSFWQTAILVNFFSGCEISIKFCVTLINFFQKLFSNLTTSFCNFEDKTPKITQKREKKSLINVFWRCGKKAS